MNRKSKQIAITLAIYSFLVPSAVQFAQSAQTSNSTATKNSTTKPKLLDLNFASKDELKALPGIDDAGAQRIIGGRPYRKKIELLSRSILPKTAYDKIGMLVIVTQSSKSSPVKKPS